MRSSARKSFARSVTPPVSSFLQKQAYGAALNVIQTKIKNVKAQTREMANERRGVMIIEVFVINRVEVASFQNLAKIADFKTKMAAFFETVPNIAEALQRDRRRALIHCGWSPGPPARSGEESTPHCSRQKRR